MLYQTQGIILKRTDFSETSQLFSIYSSGLGKIEVIGRGTKKIKSKLNSQMQFFAVIDLEIARGKNCYKMIFTSGTDRPDAHKFYEKLGFKKWGLEFRKDL